MHNEYPSPDGRFLLQTSNYEVRMSHWIEEPYLQDLSNDETVFDLVGSGWSLYRYHWGGGGQSLLLELRRYPGRDPSVIVLADLASGRVRTMTDEDELFERIKASGPPPDFLSREERELGRLRSLLHY